jgi:hypothetical protein
MPAALLSMYLQCLFTLLPILQRVSRTAAPGHVTRSGRQPTRHRPLIGRARLVMRNPSRCLAGFLLLSIGGCTNIGPGRLDQDHLGYARAVANAEMEQTLLNMVLRRYADVPTFLSLNQVVQSYTLQASAGVSAGTNVTLVGQTGTLTGNAQFSQTPTMTFSPITGAQFAGSFVRPFAPYELFPLAQNGVPIAVLLRFAVQSIGDLNNALRLENTPLASSARQVGSPGFFKLLDDLQTLQDGGALSFRFTTSKSDAPTNSKTEPRVYLSISTGADSTLDAVAAETRRLLNVGPGEIEIIYAQTASNRNQVAMITRSFIGILAYVSAQIDVPNADVDTHRTIPSIGYASTGQRPSVVVQTSTSLARPDSAFVAIVYRNRWFWIADNDFESKVAFSAIQILMNIAQGETNNKNAPILTIPATR